MTRAQVRSTRALSRKNRLHSSLRYSQTRCLIKNEHCFPCRGAEPFRCLAWRSVGWCRADHRGQRLCAARQRTAGRRLGARGADRGAGRWCRTGRMLVAPAGVDHRAGRREVDRPGRSAARRACAELGERGYRSGAACRRRAGNGERYPVGRRTGSGERRAGGGTVLVGTHRRPPGTALAGCSG